MYTKAEIIKNEFIKRS